MRWLILPLLLISSLLAQQPQGADTTPRYQANLTANGLSTTAASVAVQQVASGQHNVVFEAAWVYCSVACTFTIAQNGAVASATALTVSVLNLSPPTTVTAYSASNGGGSPAYVSNAYQVAAGTTYPINMSQYYLTQNGGTAQNLTIKTSAISGNAEITIQWVEK